MRILHVTLGLLDYRSGGLSKYSSDLMAEQARLGNEVYLLYPGHYNIFRKKTEIVFERCSSNIRVYELINPNLVPLLSGISRPDRIVRQVPKDIYVKFLENVKPEIIHFHTFMGIHKELLLAAKKSGITTIFTTHDYYGLCPKVNLVDYAGAVCADCYDSKRCVICNANGYDSKMIYAMQTKLYRKYKNSRLAEHIRGYIAGKQCKEAFPESHGIEYKGYDSLRNYYMEMFKLIDYFHFNSSVVKSEYEKYLDVKGKMITISHSGISDNRMKKRYDGEQAALRIAYIGSAEVFKGIYLLLGSLNQLRDEGIINWHMTIYGPRSLNKLAENNKFITFHGKYDYKDLEKIFRNVDILVVPSIGKETFGFVGLEAMSYGVPVLASENAGIRDLIIHGKTGLLFKPEKTYLKEILKQIIDRRTILTKINQNICDMEFVSDFNGHVNDIMNYYNEVLTQAVKQEKKEEICLNQGQATQLRRL